MEARGEAGAGTIGDILAARVLARGGAGIVTDGGVRDSPGVAELAIPTYFQAPNAASLWLKHIPLDVDVPITCAGMLVMPGDVVVGDAEGVVDPARRAGRGDRPRRGRAGGARGLGARARARPASRSAASTRSSDERRAEYERWRAARNEEQPR